MILLFATSCVLLLNYIVVKSIGMGSTAEVPSMLLSLIPFIILIITSFSLTQEFSNKTDKIIFTGIFSRNEIMISKLASFIFTSIVLVIFYEVICIICSTFNPRLLLNNLYVFILYTFTLGSFILLVSTITSNFIITGIIGYVLYFDLILVLLNQALVSNRSEMLKQVIENLPFYIANTGFYMVNYTAHQAIIMAGFGVLSLGLACGIINGKNM